MKTKLKIKNVINPYKQSHYEESNYYWYGWSGDKTYNLHLRNNQCVKPKVLNYFFNIWKKYNTKTWEQILIITIEKFELL